ncbi:hypothetical protein CSOJ01_14184 [Colletotrichum sojae]|uniref:Uncharacterized protein n=1 Tax=Colletotrichum sojae TaxID=2175907 RepID=A0A8H6IR48_9PEZI|nr:hypothetical protein CSOJ01_14184 [Colletotrichum sojae]
MASGRGHRPRLFPSLGPMGSFPPAAASLRLLLADLDPGSSTGATHRTPLAFTPMAPSHCTPILGLPAACAPPASTPSRPTSSLRCRVVVVVVVVVVVYGPPPACDVLGFAQGLLGHGPWTPPSVMDGDGAAVVLACRHGMSFGTISSWWPARNCLHPDACPVPRTTTTGTLR